MSERNQVAEFLDDGPVKGMLKFLLPKKTIFVHWLPNAEETHLIETAIIYTKGKKSFVFCLKHSEYVDVSCKEDGKK